MVQKHWIKHKITFTYSPESYEQAEKLDQALVHIAKSKIEEAPNSLAEPLWEEAVLYGNYVRKRLPTWGSNAAKHRMKSTMEVN